MIDPVNLMRIPHAHLQRESYQARYKVEGKMPDDFHGKLVAAIKKSIVLEPKKMKLLLSYVGEEADKS